MEARTTGTGARCAVHVDQSASGICARCGNFMCDTCSNNGQYEQCTACRALTGDIAGFPYNRENFTVEGIFGVAWDAFKREWPMLSAAVLVQIMVSFGISFVFGLVSNGLGLVDVGVSVAAQVVGNIF